jgi:uncharacterized protein
MSIKENIISDLTAAMKSQDALRTSTLRMVKAAIMNREIEKGAGSQLTDEEVLKTLQSLVKQRRDSFEQYVSGGRQELADKEQAEIEIIEKYLPQAASQEELEQAVAKAIASTNAETMRDMGKVMKEVQAILAGRSVDNRMLSELVKSRLSS